MGVQENEDADRLVSFYLLFSFSYFPLLVTGYLWTNGLAYLGKYHFQLILVVILVAESIKYFVANFLFQKKSFGLGKKNETGICAFIFKLFQGARLKEGIKIIISVALMTLFYYVMAILFGAELLDKYEETLMFSWLLSVLTVFPISINLGCNYIGPLLLGTPPASKLQFLLCQNMYFTLAGAWIGAIAIPLDWDRDWQKWPITCSLGAIIGFVVSHAVMRVRLTSRNLNSKRIL